MAVLDWVFLAILLVSLGLGAWRGLVSEVLSVASWIAAFFLAQWFAPNMAAWLPVQEFGPAAQYACGFVAVVVLTVFAGGLLAFVVKKLMAAVGMGPADRLLGAGFGLLRGTMIVLALTVVVGLTPLRHWQVWTSAIGPVWAQTVMGALKPLLPQDFGKYLP